MRDRLTTNALFLPCLSPMRPMMSPPTGRIMNAPPYTAKLATRRDVDPPPPSSSPSDGGGKNTVAMTSLKKPKRAKSYLNGGGGWGV
jgi:hypothetical protein